MKPFSNRKKIRGWKNQVKKIDTWFENNRQPDIKIIETWRDEYVKVWIDPWYRLEKRNPPLWYFREILDKLAQMYTLWERDFRKSTVSYDLQLWVYEKNYILSELVCTRTENEGEIRDNFFIPCSERKDFPVSKFKSKSFNPNLFEWTLRCDTINYFEKADELTGIQIQELLQNGFQEGMVAEGTEDEQRHFFKPSDYVWVGRKK